MKINLRGWEHSNFDSKKLPTEEDLIDFFSCVLTEPEDNGTGFFINVPKFDYSNTANNSSYSRHKYPVFSGTKDSWIVPSLTSLPPETKLSSTLHNLLGDEKYDEDHDVGIRKVPALGLTLPSETIKVIENAAGGNCVSAECTVKNFKDLHHVRYKIENFITSFIGQETTTFKKGLVDGNYIQKNSHQDILEKIIKIREVAPLNPIFIVAETPLLDYLNVHSLFPGELEKNVWLIQDNQTSYSYRETNTFGNYKSAVFSIEQMSGDHSFELHYRLQRGNRQWRIYMALIGRMAIDIPPDPLQEKDGKFISEDNHPRWDRLF